MVAHKYFNSTVDELIVLENLRCVEKGYQRNTHSSLKNIRLFNILLVLNVIATTLATGDSPGDRFRPNMKNIGVVAINTNGDFDTFGILHALCHFLCLERWRSLELTPLRRRVFTPWSLNIASIFRCARHWSKSLENHYLIINWSPFYLLNDHIVRDRSTLDHFATIHKASSSIDDSMASLDLRNLRYLACSSAHSPTAAPKPAWAARYYIPARQILSHWLALLLSTLYYNRRIIALRQRQAFTFCQTGLLFQQPLFMLDKKIISILLDLSIIISCMAQNVLWCSASLSFVLSFGYLDHFPDQASETESFFLRFVRIGHCLILVPC